MFGGYAARLGPFGGAGWWCAEACGVSDALLAVYIGQIFAHHRAHLANEVHITDKRKVVKGADGKWLYVNTEGTG